MAKRTCSVSEGGDRCLEEARYASPEPMCSKHYQRWRRLGAADAAVQVQVRGRSVEERRERKNALARSEYARNPEGQRVRQQRYEDAHPEKMLERRQRRVSRSRVEAALKPPRIPKGRNSEARKAASRRWAAAHPDRRRRANPAAVKGAKRRWRENHPEQQAEINRAKTRRRKARMRQAEVVPYRELDIYERDRWRCQLCRRKVDKRLRYPDPGAATIDHVVPIALGGADTPANVQLAHFLCNSAKRTKAMGEQLRLIG